jgi:3-oxoacyl-[acyl-carrier-protein] synthase II
MIRLPRSSGSLAITSRPPRLLSVAFLSTSSPSLSSRRALPSPPPARPPRRVVVTGMGCVTPLGCNTEKLWTNLIAGKSGVRRIDDPAITSLELAPTVAASVRRGTNKDEGEFDLATMVPKAVVAQSSPFIHFALAAAQQAITQSGWIASSDHAAERTGVAFGSGIGCVDESAQAGMMLKEKGKKGVSAYSIPKLLVNLAAGQISQYNKKPELHLSR